MNQGEEKDFLEYPDELSIHYIYSVGELTKFFREVKENGRLFGTKCTKCGFVYLPPRMDCSKCYVPTEWIPLSGKGEITAATICTFGVSKFTGKLPIVIAFMKLDGTDMAIRHTIVMDDEEITIDKLKKGTRVKVQFISKAKREGKITDFYFVLDKD
ncbi:MAG: Zn-ribbon domain-containing OB-fold protein [Candidatus Helarchaeota archaeon]|nr:Zn-ribbon domain-containing OB-fold protein [Candidatus Helarchaeota archaeon]